MEKERVILVGVILPKTEESQFQYSMLELRRLVDTAHGVVVQTLTQKIERVNRASFIGSGKLEELATLVEMEEADTVIFNGELSATQIRNLDQTLGVKIIDRTQLILDIFAMRAKSRAGKLQVSYAQAKYLLPRLAGQGVTLSRLGGGIGTRGPGESKLELDRRFLRRNMNEIKKQLIELENHRSRLLKRRVEQKPFRFALIGYTNAGKSTIFNRLSLAAVLQENQLFATLDPTTRKVKLDGGLEVLLTDTVGFIQDLPTTLIEAFKSTLEESREADCLLHIVDSSNPDYVSHEKTVYAILAELEMGHIPCVTIYNKIDKKTASFTPDQPYFEEISAVSEAAPKYLKQMMENQVRKVWKPYYVEIKATEGKTLAKYKAETLIDELSFDETTESYHLRGFYSGKDKLE
ncbi:GTPase HflX [Listeria sp. PSOL-1]|uniref:GTPase HflX n=1 Tax=Listeria sp. PSOL-1 TaxID=1844999 RepID=UPI0013D77DF8|nr:GTPase HflX [Listeria sp. PSOL-1]